MHTFMTQLTWLVCLQSRKHDQHGRDRASLLGLQLTLDMSLYMHKWMSRRHEVLFHIASTGTPGQSWEPDTLLLLSSSNSKKCVSVTAPMWAVCSSTFIAACELIGIDVDWWMYQYVHVGGCPARHAPGSHYLPQRTSLASHHRSGRWWTCVDSQHFNLWLG